MEILAKRMLARIDQLGLARADVAKASGISYSRFNNYVQGTRTPDLETLIRLARALRTSTDWLLGISDNDQVETYTILLRLLELEGLPDARAEVIARSAQEALRLLASLPPEGDARARSRLAAQAVWQIGQNAGPR